MSLVDVVIVNWNAGNLLRECVDSVTAFAGDNSSVTVVDNASTDGSVKHLNALAAAGRIALVRLPENAGFARACNIGATHSCAEFILFLNPDARIHEATIVRAVEFMRSQAGLSYGICGVRLEGDRGITQRHCARFPTLRTFVGKVLGLNHLFPRLFPPHFMVEFDHESSREVDQVIGAFFFVRRSVFEALGGFDEQFFVYFEELDFSLRARKAGWRTWYLAEAHAYHKGGGSSDQVKAKRLFYSLRSRLLYGFKHFGAIEAWALVLLTSLLEPLVRLAQATWHMSPASFSEVIRATFMLWRSLPAVFSSDHAAVRRAG